MIITTAKSFENTSFEFVERKGRGHPDTLADALAEYLSVMYSNFTLKKFGAILHHNFDKVSLLGGSSSVTFGKGYLVDPIRVLFNGRASIKFGDENIPVKELLRRWTKVFFSERFPMINPDRDLEFHYNIRSNSSPGRRSLTISPNDSKNSKSSGQYWFQPRNLDDVLELKHLVANDTSIGVGYAPETILEKIVLEIEQTLNSPGFKEKNLWIGSDIKIMGFRSNKEIYLTMCVPQIADLVNNIEEYKRNILTVKDTIIKIRDNYDFDKFELNINTRDDYQLGNIYLTAIGSAIEIGDEGVVGRGNRINGVITPTKPMSMEGSCGKNPVYYAGKVYYILAMDLAQKIYNKYSLTNEVFISSQVGRDLIDPWIVLVALPLDTEMRLREEIKDFIYKELQNIPGITSGLLKGDFRLY